MNQKIDPDEKISAAFQGEVSGTVSVGSGNVTIGRIDDGIVNIGSGTQRVTYTAAEVAELRRQVSELAAALKQQVQAEAPAEQAGAAAERVDELEQAITADPPDLDTIGYVKNWFAKNLPALAGAVGSLVVSPLVSKIVEASGDVVASEFVRRFLTGG